MIRGNVLYPRACDLGWRIPVVMAIVYVIWFHWLILYTRHLFRAPPSSYVVPQAGFSATKLAMAGLIGPAILFLIAFAWIRSQPGILADSLLIPAAFFRTSTPFTDILFIRIFSTKQGNGCRRVRFVDVQTREFRLYTIWRTQLASPERFRKVLIEDIADQVEVKDEVFDVGV